MKTAILATALIATASFASAQANHFEVIETSASGAQIEIVTRQYGTDVATVFERSIVNCLPMMLGTIDQAGNLEELAASGTADMEEVVRGTLRHEIAVTACGNG